MFDAQAEDTICALSTPPGHGGIAVIRVSGPKSLRITRALCPKLPPTLESHTIHYSKLMDRNGGLIDDPLISFFEHGRSYTGEETVEISCHGGSVVSQLILNELVHHGCRPAEKGEFTYRAFINGRIDLVQAENVLELIDSQSAPAARLAARNLQGELSLMYGRIEDLLVWCLAQLEASIDFSTEDIDYVDLSGVQTRIVEIVSLCQQLISSYHSGKALKDGFNVVILGSPNAGKSSLLNAILGVDRAIVSDVAGTTRDVIEGQTIRNGVLFRLYDTAGIRDSEDKIEQLGVKRAVSSVDNADAIIWVIDPQLSSQSDELFQTLKSSKVPVLIFGNKFDILHESFKSSVTSLSDGVSAHFNSDTLFGSTRSQSTLQSIGDWLSKVSGYSVYGDHVVVTQARHIHQLETITSACAQVIELLVEQASPEIIAFELQTSVKAIHDILGKEFHEQVIDRIFKEFCLGK